MQVHKYDVVIVGAGGAGMRAAIESGQRARTAVLTKLYPTRSHTGAAQGGMCAALANVEEDNWEWHTFDTVKGGDYLVDQDAAEVMAKEAIDAVLDLEKMGLPFNRTPEGRIDQRRFGGHTRDHGKAPVRRACYAADRTGHMILQTLYQNCVKHNVEFYNEYYVLDLLTVVDEETGQKRVSGVVSYDLASGELHVFQAKSVVFASGGAGKVAGWFVDTDYDGRTFCVCQAFFPDQDAWGKIAKALGSRADEEAFEAFKGTESLPFEAGKHARIAVKVIDPRGNEVMTVRKLES